MKRIVTGLTVPVVLVLTVGCTDKEPIPKVAKVSVPTTPSAQSPAPAEPAKGAEAPTQPASGSAPTAKADGAGGWGTIKGRVVWAGAAPPEQKTLDVQKDQAVCLAAGPLKDETIVINAQSKGMLNVFAYLRDKGLKIHPDAPQKKEDVRKKYEEEYEKLNGFKVADTLKALADGKKTVKDLQAPAAHYNPKQPLWIDQVHCTYIPHAIAVREGQPTLVKNHETIAHNVKVVDPLGKNDTNPLMSPNTIQLFEWLTVTQPLSIECGIHGWMKMNAMVFDHPHFAVTDDNGAFEIKNVPAGEVTIVLRYPKYIDPIKGGKGNANGAKIMVKAGETTDLGEIKYAGE